MTVIKIINHKTIRWLLSSVLRLVYHHLPLSDENKYQLKSFLYRWFAYFIKNTNSYQQWLINNEIINNATLDYYAGDSKVDNGFNQKKNIRLTQYSKNDRLSITVFVPYNFMPQTFGGGLRIMSVYKELSNYYQVNLIGIVGYGAGFKLYEINDSLTVYLVPMTKSLNELLIIEQNKASGLLHDVLLTNNYKIMPKLIELCNQLIPKTDIFVTSQPYFIKMLLEYCNNKILIYDAQNVEYDLKKSYFGNMNDNETANQYMGVIKEAEALACEKSEFILCVSNEDAEKLHQSYKVSKDKIVMVPNGIDVFGCNSTTYRWRMNHKERAGIKSKQIVFVGSAHGPNIDAVDFILNDIAEKNKDLTYTIVGGVSSAFINRNIPSNVHFTGIVNADTKESIYETADIAINPMFSGSGTNLKVLEYIAYKIPTVSSRFGMRGLELFDNVICSAKKENFMEVIEKTLSLPSDVLDGNAEKARRICEKYFDKLVISERLINKINEIEIKRKKTNGKHNIAIDGRILHRDTTGSERYIHELVKHVAEKNQKSKHQLWLVNNSGINIEGVSNIPYVFEGIDLFHRSYQVRSNSDLLELSNAKKSIYTFLDLILCKNPDYFNNKKDHLKYIELMDLALNSVDRIIAISEHAKKDVIEYFHIPEEKIDVVYLGLDIHKFKVVSDKKEIDSFRKAYNLPKKYLLYVGTDYPHKNLKNLYIAFAGIMNLPEMIDYRLVVAGANYYDRGVKSLRPYFDHIQHRIISLGHFPDEKMHYLYNAASIFVVPSLYEGFGLTVLEAMACGTPVVCSNATSLPEVAGDAAYMVDANDPKLIAKAIVKIAANSYIRNTLIEKGLKRVKQFTWEKCAENTYAVYSKLLNELDAEQNCVNNNSKQKVII